MDNLEVQEVLTRLRERIAEASADAYGDLCALGVDEAHAPALMTGLTQFQAFAERDRSAIADWDAHMWQARQEASCRMRMVSARVWGMLP